MLTDDFVTEAAERDGRVPFIAVAVHLDVQTGVVFGITTANSMSFVMSS